MRTPSQRTDGLAPLTARVPGSKSITNRALLPAAAATGVTRLRAPRVSDDTLAFRTALTGLGVRITETGDACVAKTFPGFHDELRRLFPGAATPQGI
ncbi:hypothetical protein ACFXPW_03435 [Streptomyces goshikiensis]|uniref:hypothetical protein n=1 Tax=Streptomyces goshikiensis TaxID=1942 RepID=UPI0036AC7DB4